MQVIYAENERTKNVVDELENEFIFIEEKIIPRMGGFHVIGMVKTIYTFFKNTGIV